VGREADGACSSFAANSFGIFDMQGNVWQWVQDNWHPNCQGAPTDGSVWSRGGSPFHVNRGGPWHNDPQQIRSASRGVELTLPSPPSIFSRIKNDGFVLAER
jgi:formylglycine-generating enzyme required for sulfatase activity